MTHLPAKQMEIVGGDETRHMHKPPAGYLNKPIRPLRAPLFSIPMALTPLRGSSSTALRPISRALRRSARRR